MMQDSGEVLTRGRKIENDTPPASRTENVRNIPALQGSENGCLTVRNPEFDRRMTELRKQLALDRAAAQAELTRLSDRCDILKDFLLEADNTARSLEDLNAIIHAEKEFAVRMEQLEIRYYRSYGKYADNASLNTRNTSGNCDCAVQTPAQGGFKSALPLMSAIVTAALIIAFAMALIFG
jgi:hypothetical protein